MDKYVARRLLSAFGSFGFCESLSKERSWYSRCAWTYSISMWVFQLIELFNSQMNLSK